MYTIPGRYGPLLALALLFPAAAAASKTAVMSVSYGKVVDIGEIAIGDDGRAAATGATVGGIVGLGTSSRATSGRKRRSLAIGSAIGATAGRAAGNQSAFSYTVDMVDGARVAIVTEQAGIRVGDCVSLERGRDSANIREVAQVFCDTPQAVPYEEHVREADQCQQAKAALLDTPDDKLEAAVTRVRILCDD